MIIIILSIVLWGAPVLQNPVNLQPAASVQHAGGLQSSEFSLQGTQ